MTSAKLRWPHGKKVAVALTVMFETWSEGAAPSYSVQATSLAPGTTDYGGHAWSTYGGRVGVYRILRSLDRWDMRATFFTNAACAERYPDAVKAIAKAGHDLGGHAIYQDQLLTYLEPDEQFSVIERSLDALEEIGGTRPTGWLSPALAFTPDTVGLLAKAGLSWHADVTYFDLPHVVSTDYGAIAAVPNSDFTDNRVLRSNVRDLLEVHVSAFEYLRQHEPIGFLALTLHCQFGGRPMVIGVMDELIAYLSTSDDVWFATHAELAQWALDSDPDTLPYRNRW